MSANECNYGSHADDGLRRATLDPRVTFGIPIIGCPDYLTLMSERAAQSKVPVAPPYFPVSFLAYVRAHDPAAAPHTADAPRGGRRGDAGGGR